MNRHLLRRSLNRAPTQLNVMTSFEGAHPEVLQVLILSLSETQPQDEIVFWLLHQYLLPDQISALDAYCTSLGNVTLRSVEITETESFDRLKSLGGKPDSARFLWLIAHQYLPDDLTRIIYLDAADILVTDDLVPLTHHPFLGKSLVACREVPDVPPLMIGPARQAHRWGMPKSALRYISQGLINSGATVINLDKFRRNGIEIGHYLQVAEWANATLAVKFGDQGLFSLTHGSDYVQAHNRYNYRFSYETRGQVMQQPAVIHYAGTVIKPARWRLSDEMEQVVSEHLLRTGDQWLYLDSRRRIGLDHLPYLRRWWDMCERTPGFSELAPIATKRLSQNLARIGLTAR